MAVEQAGYATWRLRAYVAKSSYVALSFLVDGSA